MPGSLAAAEGDVAAVEEEHRQPALLQYERTAVMRVAEMSQQGMSGFEVLSSRGLSASSGIAFRWPHRWDYWDQAVELRPGPEFLAPCRVDIMIGGALQGYLHRPAQQVVSDVGVHLVRVA